MFGSRTIEFSDYLQQLCSFCYKENKYCVFHEDKCTNCKKRNISAVYVNAKEQSEFVRDFRNSGNAERGTSIEKCNHQDVANKYLHAIQYCSYALNNFEYFIWNWMKTNRKYKISEIYTEFIAQYLYRPMRQPCKISMVVDRKTYANAINPLPQSKDENERFQQDEKKKIYFCWFCFKSITSENDIDVHVNGSDHKRYYEADKRRRWYYKMPKSRKPSICDEPNCDCHSPHSDDECQEMLARIKVRDFTYKTVLKKDITPWPINIELTMSMFPNNIACYKNGIKSSIKLTITGCSVTNICLGDDESRPFFTLHDYDNNQKGQSLNLTNYEKPAKNYEYHFYIEFAPIASGTYIQRIEIKYIFKDKEYFCQKVIRIDVGTSKHLDQFSELWTKYNPILKRNLKFFKIVPFSIDRYTDIKPMSEDLLRRVFKVVSNLQWMDTRVESWNYCDWMKDMMVHEELEQQLLLSQLIFVGDIRLSSTIDKDGFLIAKPGQLYGTITFKNECHSLFAREFVAKNINRVFVLFSKENNTQSLYECDLVDNYYYEKELRSVLGVTLCFPESAVIDLQLKSGIVSSNTVIYFRYNRMVFDRRHNAIDKMPMYDALSYIPLCCPSFTRLPYGESAAAVSFTPKLTLNVEQQRLPRLVLRDLACNEVVLPFILNGAFGTGKTSVIAETVRTILGVKNSKSRILICTRSYSAADVYLGMLNGCLDDKLTKMLSKIKKVIPNRRYDFEFLDQTIKNEAMTLNIFENIRVFITSLDNVTDAMSPVEKYFDDKNPMFDYLFVDEAAQVLEVDAVMVYQFGNKRSKFIFAGDVFQVRPDFHNMSLKKFAVPIICRLHLMYKHCPDYEICLKQVYRAHPTLVKYLSYAIYQHCGLTSKMKPLYPHIAPMKFIDSNTNGDFSETFDETFCSFKNDHEAKMVLFGIQTLLTRFQPDVLSEDRILVCSPFYSQVKLIRDKLKKKGLMKIVVLQPSNIQGKEFDAVFISAVLTVNNELKHPILHPTFHSNKNLINLTISRAKHYVEVIGDKKSLLKHQCKFQWEKFIEFCNISADL